MVEANLSTLLVGAAEGKSLQKHVPWDGIFDINLSQTRVFVPFTDFFKKKTILISEFKNP